MTESPRTARDLARVELTRRIVEVARGHLARVGPGELSLRAVARDLGLVSSAVYRYFPSRDHLITALLVACYDESGEAVEIAEAAVARPLLRERWLAVAHALRGWALAHRHEWALLYGSPVPGYAAPQDTVASATRLTTVLVRLLADAEAAGVPLGVPGPASDVALVEGLGPLKAFAGGVAEPRLVAGTAAWATLMGAVSLELFGHLHRGVLDYDAWFSAVAERVADDLGLLSVSGPGAGARP